MWAEHSARDFKINKSPNKVIKELHVMFFSGWIERLFSLCGASGIHMHPSAIIQHMVTPVGVDESDEYFIDASPGTVFSLFFLCLLYFHLLLCVYNFKVTMFNGNYKRKLLLGKIKGLK